MCSLKVKGLPLNPLLAHMHKDASPLFYKHLGLVSLLVNKRAKGLPANIDRADLTQAGYIGLLKASEDYNPSVGVKFTTYATTRINGHFLDLLRDSDYLSRGSRDHLTMVQRGFFELEHALLRKPTVSEVAGHLGISIKKVYEYMALEFHDVAKLEDLGIPDGHEDFFGVEHVDEYEHKQMWQAIIKASEDLPPRLRRLIELLYEQGITQEAVSHEFGVTPSRIKQLQLEAIKLLQKKLANWV